MKHTPEPWQLTTITFELRNTDSAAAIYGPSSVNNGACLIADISRSPGDDTAEANAVRIVDCVNACAGQNIEDVKLATAHKEACVLWETEMMKAIGEDGVGSVSKAISALQKQNEILLQAIRDYKVVSPDSRFFELHLPEDIKQLL